MILPFLTCMLFMHVLSYLQIFGDFPAILLLLISSLMPLWSESILCMISILLYLSRCFIAQNIVYFGECSMWIEKDVYSTLVRWSIFYTSVRSSWWWCCSDRLCPSWLPVSSQLLAGVLNSPIVGLSVSLCNFVFSLSFHPWSSSSPKAEWGVVKNVSFGVRQTWFRS